MFFFFIKSLRKIPGYQKKYLVAQWATGKKINLSDTANVVTIHFIASLVPQMLYAAEKKTLIRRSLTLLHSEWPKFH